MALILLTAGCQQKMAEQPHYRAYDPSNFFPDGQSARPIPEGTVAQEWPTAGDPLITFLRPGVGIIRAADRKPVDQLPAPAPEAPTDPAKFVTNFPFPLTNDDLRRGQERFTIFCTMCHGPLGDGNGRIVERGYVRPPNYHTDRSRGFERFGKAVLLRDAPVGYLFEVVSRGYGAMPSYASQLVPEDRWKVVAYVRALQLSQHAPVAELPGPLRQAAEKALGGSP